MNAPWHVQLLGGLRARQGTQTITRFRSQKIGALFAYLALFRQRTHPREELVDLLWPDVDLDVGRNNLRTALASLRRQLEPEGAAAAGSVIQAQGRHSVSLHPDAVLTDVAEFEAAMDAAARAETPGEQARLLAQAVQVYGGPLLPGFHDTWALGERDRLAEAYLRALQHLTAYLEQAGEIDKALEYAHRAVKADPLREQAHADVARLQEALKQAAAATRRSYDEAETLLEMQAEELSRAVQKQPLGSKEADLAFYSGESIEAVAEEASSLESPPLTEEEPTPTHLPTTFTRFFGREDEIRALGEVLCSEGVRLVTLTGPGGCGKTRLAIEAARRSAKNYPGGVWFVSLADLSEAARIPDAIASALGLPHSPTLAPLEQVAEALADRAALLILDSFEHLVEEGAALVRTLLLRTPRLCCLVTSRQRLLLEGEQEFPLLPLPVPSFPGAPERLLEFASVQLFLDRCRAARPDFQITPRNAEAVATLCARLEGIPLALELSAAWSQTLTPAQMLERLEQRFDLLVSRRRDLSPRHQTLRATIDWSYRLLTPQMRRFFTRLSVFRGGWTLEAAEAVCDTPNAMLHLATLREHSLIVADKPTGGDGATMRYRMLETLCDFAASLLSQEDQAAFTRRHADFYCALAQQAESEFFSPKQLDWMRRLDADRGNLRAALHFCHETPGEKKRGLRLAGALGFYWEVRSYLTEARDFLRVMLDEAEDASEAVDDAVRAKAWEISGRLAFCQGDLGTSERHNQRALELYRMLGDGAGTARCLNGLGIVAQWRGERARACEIYQEGLAIAEKAGDALGISHLCANLGLMLTHTGDFAKAQEYLERSVVLLRKFGESYYLGIQLGMMALNQFQQNDSRAPATLREAVARVTMMESWWCVPYFLDFLAYDCVRRGMPERAATLLGASEAIREQTGGVLPETGLGEHANFVAAARSALGEAAFRASWDEGQTMPRDKVISFAME